MKTAAWKGLMAIIVFSFLLFSCKKETTCYASITVIASNGTPVAGATVKLDCSTCPSPGPGQSFSTDNTQTTDASGKASFTFKYEAVLDVTVTSSQGNATSVVKLEAGKTVDKTIQL